MGPPQERSLEEWVPLLLDFGAWSCWDDQRRESQTKDINWGCMSFKSALCSEAVATTLAMLCGPDQQLGELTMVCLKLQVAQVYTMEGSRRLRIISAERQSDLSFAFFEACIGCARAQASQVS